MKTPGPKPASRSPPWRFPCTAANSSSVPPPPSEPPGSQRSGSPRKIFSPRLRLSHSQRNSPPSIRLPSATPASRPAASPWAPAPLAPVITRIKPRLALRDSPTFSSTATDKVTVLTKTWARDPATARADLDRFRRELRTDYLDICLMHCLTEADWTERYKGVMDVFSEARQKGTIRAHGCSCHSIEALRAAAKSPWVEVDLARINPIGSHMDADPETVVGVLRSLKAAGKAVIGMKILGQGDLAKRQDEAIKYALSLGVLDAFTIGAESKPQQEDLIRRIATA